MAPPRSPAREARSRHACDSCRRKKTRCPGERPACSSCARLGQTCSYRMTTRESLQRANATEERLAQLEARLNDMARDGPRAIDAVGDDTSNRHDSEQASTDFDTPRHTLSISVLQAALQVYSVRLYRQPIWCFDPREIHDLEDVTNEVALALQVLVSHFDCDISSYQTSLGNARKAVMSRLATGSVCLTTIEAICFIAQSCFIAGDFSLGRFHLSLGFSLCQAASMDVAYGYPSNHPANEEKRRVFWTLQILRFCHGQPSGLVGSLDQVFQACETLELTEQSKLDQALPTMPDEYDDFSGSTETGVWSMLMQVACTWSRARAFVASCIKDEVQEPWHASSSYAQTLADLMTIEGKTPMCHRWQTVKFYCRDNVEVENNGQYWKPWLAVQITYHLVLTIMNHPFLHMTAAQNNRKLAVTNTFWTRSSQTVLLHATWIVRIAEMILDRQIQLSDPIFGQAAAIAATVHLYYLSASHPRLKQDSAANLAKSRRFLQSFRACSPLCRALDDRLGILLEAALGPYSTTFEAQPPDQISLKSRLMWDVLSLACSDPLTPIAGNSLLHWSFTPADSQQDLEDMVFDVGCEVSSPVEVDTSSGGQSAPTIFPSQTAAFRSGFGVASTNGAQSFSTNPATNQLIYPWLWDTNQSQMNANSYDLPQIVPPGNTENWSWWNVGNL